MLSVAGLRGAIASIAAWTLGVVAAVSVGLVALAMIGTGLTSSPVEPLSDNAADQVPGTSAGSTTGPPTSKSAPPSSSPSNPRSSASTPDRWRDPRKLLGSRGGTVIAQCHTGFAYLISWSPAQGFQAQDVMRGPAFMAGVTFKGLGREIRMSVSCPANTPHADIHDEADGGDN
jgi:hypothetical protein